MRSYSVPWALGLSFAAVLGCSPASSEGEVSSHDAPGDAAPSASPLSDPAEAISIDGGGGSSESASPRGAELYGEPFVLETQRPFLFNGTTAPFEIPLRSGDAGIVVRTSPTTGSANESVCFQLDSVIDSEGSVWIPPATTHEDWQSSCSTCKERASVGRGYGLFSFPNNGEPLPTGRSITLRIALRNCETYLPFNSALDGPPPEAVNVEIARLPEPPAIRARLGVAFVFARGGAFSSKTAPSDPLIKDAIASLRRRFEPAQIDVDVAYADMPASAKAELSFGNADQHELDELQQTAETAIALALPSRAEIRTTVPVIFSPCLVHTGAGGPESLHAYVPRIPAGFSTGRLADAVFIEEANCNTRPSVARKDGAVLGKLVAHELGHYLGLHHTVEADTQTDHIADTGANNLMHYNPLLASSDGFSDSQVRVMRLHPYIATPHR